MEDSKLIDPQNEELDLGLIEFEGLPFDLCQPKLEAFKDSSRRGFRIPILSSHDISGSLGDTPVTLRDIGATGLGISLEKSKLKSLGKFKTLTLIIEGNSFEIPVCAARVSHSANGKNIIFGLEFTLHSPDFSKTIPSFLQKLKKDYLASENNSEIICDIGTDK